MSDPKADESRAAYEAPVDAPSDSEDRLLAFADRLRHGTDEHEEEREEPETWVAFRLENRGYALPVTHVHEFSKIGHVSRVPGAPSSVYGVASLRGHAIPIVDLKQLLGLSTDESPEPDRVLVADHQGRRIGLIVDRVDRVFKLLPSLIKKVPAGDEIGDAGWIRGLYALDETELVLLEPDTFLGHSSQEGT